MSRYTQPYRNSSSRPPSAVLATMQRGSAAGGLVDAVKKRRARGKAQKAAVPRQRPLLRR